MNFQPESAQNPVRRAQLSINYETASEPLSQSAWRSMAMVRHEASYQGNQ